MLLSHLSLDCAGTCTWYRGVATGHRVASTHDPFHIFSCMARLLEIWSLQRSLHHGTVYTTICNIDSQREFAV